MTPTTKDVEPTISATEVLRRMLDESGVEWGNIRRDGSESDYLTEWQFEDNRGKAIAIEWAVGSGLSVEVHRYHCTPEQAIDATLGRGTCRNVAVPDEYSDRPFTCSECGARGPMGNGTYHLASSWAMEDGTLAFGDSWPVWKYCPNCGRKVVDE